MSEPQTFDEALDAAIDELRAGRPLDHALAARGQHGPAFVSMLHTVRSLLDAGGTVPPPSVRLAENFARVGATLRDTRIAAERVDPALARPWWTRRWSVASLSLPAAGLVLAFALGTGSAAAATVAIVAPDLTGKVADAVTPEWLEDVARDAGIGDGSEGSPGDDEHAGTAVDDATATPAPGPFSGHENGANPRQSMTVSGTIADVNGNTFTLVQGNASWKVQLDANTSISGAISDGANASVTGTLSAINRLHATLVESDAVTDAGNGDGPAPPGREPTPSRQSGETPGQQTPPGQDGEPTGPQATPPGVNVDPPRPDGGSSGQQPTPPAGAASGQSQGAANAGAGGGNPASTADD